MARTRAMDQCLPLVCAANTGISAVIDPLGRVTARLGLGETGVLDAVLPAALPAGTPYSRYGEGIVLAMAGLAMVASVALRRLGQTSRKFRSEEHTSELRSLMRISYAVFCLKKKKR